MSTMDEITYWIYTKRAPCLMDYDKLTKKANEEPNCSKPKPKSVPSATEVPSPKKKKRRKLSLLDEESGSVELQQNVYFDTSQNKKPTVLSSCKSDSVGSDVDFNIRNSHVRGKQKRSKLQKHSRKANKKNVVLTSTPKVSQLRRSLRRAQQSINNNNTQLNSSLEIFNANITNGNNQNYSSVVHNSPEVIEKSELLASGDQRTDNKKTTAVNKSGKPQSEAHNGQFEDLSDVSGFTANYIRSTKLQSTKTPRKLKCKNNRNLVKESKTHVLKDGKMIVCADKSCNTVDHNTHNCSTESENVINLVTAKNTNRTANASKTTSVLKFIDSRPVQDDLGHKKVDNSRSRGKTQLNISLNSASTTPRYPKRIRKNSPNEDEEISGVLELADERRKTSQVSNNINHWARKENPEATTVSRTRSGRSIGLSLRQPENLVLVMSNTTEQVSSMASMNVASPKVSMNITNSKERKKKRVTRHLRSKQVNEKNGSLHKDSIRDKSGFTACFSDSDNDSEPLKPRKFFCA